MECCTVRLLIAAMIALACSREMLHLEMIKLYISVLSLKAPVLMWWMEEFINKTAEIWVAINASRWIYWTSELSMLISASEETNVARGISGITTLQKLSWKHKKLSVNNVDLIRRLRAPIFNIMHITKCCNLIL